MPTRFSYAKVPSSSFGLTPVEILLSTDKELKSYMSMKKFAPYRKSKDWDKSRPEKLKELRKAIAGRAWGGVKSQDLKVNDAMGDYKGAKKKRKGKKERARAREDPKETSKQEEKTGPPEEPRKKKRKRNRGEAMAI
jgi:protein KRI1